MGLLVEPVDVSKYEFIRIPCKERWGLLTQADSPLSAQDFVTPGDLAHIPLLIAKRSLVQEELRGWFGWQFESMDLVGTYNLIYNAAVMVKNGVASALTTEHDRIYEGLRFIPLRPTLERCSVLVWKKHQTYSPAAAKFFAHVQKCSERMVGDKI